MKQYFVETTPPAERDLAEIFFYFSEILKERKVAEEIYYAIKGEIVSLNSMPERFQVIDEYPYNEVGVRRTFVKNYVIFYVIAKESQKVIVLRILHNRREWKELLENTEEK